MIYLLMILFVKVSHQSAWAEQQTRSVTPIGKAYYSLEGHLSHGKTHPQKDVKFASQKSQQQFATTKATTTNDAFLVKRSIDYISNII